MPLSPSTPAASDTHDADAASFITFNARNVSSPIIISAPHGGTDYPKNLLGGVDLAAMRTLEDSGTTEIATAIAKSGRPAIIATCPRALIDLNRPKDALDPRLFPDAQAPENRRWQRHIQAGYGIIPRLSADRHPLYLEPPAPDTLKTRIDIVHTAYHQVLRQWITGLSKHHRNPLLIDIHSMPQARQDQTALPDFIFGDLHGITLPQYLKDQVDRFMQQTTFSWGWNHPFAGGYITQHYGTGNRAIATLQIEANRGLFLTRSGADAKMLESVSDCVTALIDSLDDRLKSSTRTLL